jgi:hypothetical protein
MAFRRLSALLLLCAAAFAQEFRSTITGRVVDAQQAVVPGVKIVCTNADTGARSETVSAADGQYALPFLAPGPYRIEAEATGFKRYLRERMQLATNERLGLDIALEVGQLAESVTVSTEAPLLQTSTASTGQVVSSLEIQNMPLNGRTPIALAQLAFGVVSTGTGGLGGMMRPFDNGGVSSFSMGGAPGKANDLLVDGAPDTQSNGDVAYNPPVDAVAEVKVETFQVDAAYGHSGGGTVNVVMRGGGNALHGGLYEFNQVSRLAATPFFTNKAGLTKPVYNYNQWGTNLSGPVMLPKVLDGRNRVFFYFGYEGIHHGLPNPRTYSVPTAAEKTGNFSDLLAIGSSYQIYDPATGFKEGSRVRRQPFPGNIIPANRINPVAGKLLDYYGAPNQAAARDGQNNFLANLVEQSDYGNFHGRLDINASERHKFFFAARFNNRDTENENIFHNIATGNTSYRRNWGTTLDDVYTFTPTTVLNTRMNWTRYTNGRAVPSQGFDMTSVGFPASVAAASPIAVMPRIQPDGFATFNDFNVYDQPYDSFQIFSNLNRIAGKHSVKAGTDLRLYRNRSADFGKSPAGTYSFGTNWVRGPLDNSTAAPFGQGLASLLLGLPTGGNLDSAPTRSNQSGYYAFFIQDDIRARADLTINAGLRYDLQTVPELNGNPDVPATSRLSADTNNLGPRVGLAWDPFGKQKTVIRAGAGMYYGRTQNSTLVNLITNNGQRFKSYSFIPSTPGAPTFPNLLPSIPQGAAGRPDVVFAAEDFVNPLIYQMEFSIEQEVTKNLTLSAIYMGTRGQRMPMFRDTNLFAPTNTATYTVCADPQVGSSTACSNVARTFTVPFFKGARPNTNYGYMTAVESVVNTWYHGVVFQAKQRFARGFQLQASLTLSKAIDTDQNSTTFTASNQPLNPFNVGQDKSLSDFDQRKRFTMSGIWQPPAERIGFRPLRVFLDGFQLSGILTLADGRPYSGSTSGNPSPSGTFSGLLGAGGSSRVPFVGRNTYTNPGMATLDARIAREIRFSERFRWQLIAEAFNLANRVNITGINTTQYNVRGSVLFPRTDFQTMSATGTNIVRERQIQLGTRFTF